MRRGLRRRKIGNRGITLTEVIVVLGVIGLLSAVLLPAVQQARQSARDIECKSHLHQVGVAVHNHVDQHGRFPDNEFPQQLLPYLEQHELAGRIEDNVKTLSLDPPNVAKIRLFEGASIPAYQCPVDPLAAQVRGLVPSYLINSGTGFGNGNDGLYRNPASDGRGIRPAEISDGLSQTVAFSERLIPLGRDHYDQVDDPQTRRRLMAHTDPLRSATQIDVFADTCRDHPVWVPTYPMPCYVSFGCSPVAVNNILPPNSNSCFNGVEDGAASYAAMTASSLHHGGVHSLMADGSVRFISESIDRSVWRALGTRAGGEAIASGIGE